MSRLQLLSAASLAVVLILCCERTEAASSPDAADRFPCQCPTMQFCCGQTLCCNTTQQICAYGGFCVNVSNAPPVPPGPHQPGQLLWAHSMGATPSPPLVFPTSSSSSNPNPIVVTAGVNISAFDLITGDPVWTSPLIVDTAVANMIPVPHQNSKAGFDIVVFVGYPAVNNYIASVNTADGSTNWIYNTTELIELSCNQELYLVDDVIVAGLSYSLVGLNVRTGLPMWTVNHNPVHCAVAKQNDAFIIVDESKTLMALHPQTGDVIWQTENVNTTLFGDTIIYVAEKTIITSWLNDTVGGGLITAYGVDTGLPVWTHKFPSDRFWPSFVQMFDDVVYVVFIDSGNRQRVDAINATTGAPQWTFAFHTNQQPSVRFGYHLKRDPGSFALAAKTDRHNVRRHDPSVSVDDSDDSIALVNNGFHLYAIRKGAVVMNLTTAVGMLDQGTPPQLVNGELLFCSYNNRVVASAVDARTGDLIWQFSPQIVSLGIAASTVTGDRVPVAAIVAADTYLYGVAV